MPVELMSPADGLARTRDGMAAVRAALAAADLRAPVPACPGWTLHDLGAHVGNVHRWVRGAIVEGHPDTPEVDAPTGRSALLAWYDDGARTLVDLLAATMAGTECWTFGPRPRTARFWFRRQAHEHAVHAWDARSAVARDAAGTGAAGGTGADHAVGTVDRALAVDGIDEVVTMFFPRQVRLGRTPPLTRSLALRTTDAPGGRWVLAGDGVTGGTTPAADAEVCGPAAVLYLLLWNRLPVDHPAIEIGGDVEAARSVLNAGIVP